MSIIDEVKTLSIQIEDKDNFASMVEALKHYHEMIELGILKPRTNQIRSTYMPIEFKSNV